VVTEKAVAAVTEDKRREAGAGCDGTWVAHPDLVPVAREQFDLVLGESPNQVSRRRDDVNVTADDLLDLDFPGEVTLEGVRTNVSVGIRYLAAWLSGTGAAAIDNLMEDVATAEISRSQIWQWAHHRIVLAEGTPVTETLIRSIAAQVVDSLEGDGHSAPENLHTARKIFEEVALSDEFTDFLTIPAYELIN
jgi:malate synthase